MKPKLLNQVTSNFLDTVQTTLLAFGQHFHRMPMYPGRCCAADLFSSVFPRWFFREEEYGPRRRSANKREFKPGR